MPMPDGGGFCHKCGTQLTAGASFCARCGAPVFSSATSTLGPQQTQVRRGEKAEKHEKNEKHEKHEKGEKSGWRGMLGAIVAGLILMWLGITFFLEQNGYLPHDIWWAYFISGVGIVLILEGLTFYSKGHYGLGPIIGGALLLFGGLSAITTDNYRIASQLWPLVIVVVGALVIVAGITFRGRVPAPSV